MSDTNTLHVVHIASGDLWAGAEVQMYTLAKTLQWETDTSVTVVLLNHGRLEKELLGVGIPVTVVDETKLNVLQIFKRLARSLKDLKPDVVHTHRMKENVLGSLAAWFAGGIPSLRTVHGAPEYTYSWRTPAKWAISKIDCLCGRYLQKGIVAVSGPLAKLLQQQFPIEKIATIENGIDLEEVQRSVAKVPACSESRGAVFRVGFAGRLVAVKRVDLIIETAHFLRSHFPDRQIEFHIYGDGPLRSSLESLNRELATDKFVQFKGHNENLENEYRHLDALMLPSDNEGLPMVLLEAMYHGVPIIAHAVGGIPELLDEGRCGVLVRDHRAAGYGTAICNLASNPSHKHDMAQRALSHIRSRYSAKGNAKSYAVLYSRLSPLQRLPSADKP